MRIFNRKIRKAQLKKFGWLIIYSLAVLSMIAFTIAPAFRA
ncbi:MAG: hypothetical protein V1738_01300 [Patescibacteria group bacterium]|jgi:hypothetical protein